MLDGIDEGLEGEDEIELMVFAVVVEEPNENTEENDERRLDKLLGDLVDIEDDEPLPTKVDEAVVLVGVAFKLLLCECKTVFVLEEKFMLFLAKVEEDDDLNSFENADNAFEEVELMDFIGDIWLIDNDDDDNDNDDDDANNSGAAGVTGEDADLRWDFL